MHSIVNNKSPKLVQNIIMSGATHNYPTRRREMIPKTAARLDLMKRDLSWIGPETWNKLPEDLRDSDSTGFKTGLVKLYLADY